MNLNLKNPIVFLDLETTGVDPSKDRIVEISLVKVMPDGSREVKTRRLNPANAHSRRGFGHPSYLRRGRGRLSRRSGLMAKSLWAYIEGCDFGGYNSNKFDIPVLVEEFLRAGLDVDLRKSRFIDVQNIFHKMEQRTLVAAYKFYCDKDLDRGAFGRSRYAGYLRGADGTAGPLSRVAERRGFSGRIFGPGPVMSIMRAASSTTTKVWRYSASANTGAVPVAEVFRTEPSYYSWMMNGDFPLYTKKVITAIRLREFGNK